MRNYYQAYIKSNLPKGLQKALANFRIIGRRIWRPIRTKKLVTKILGPQFKKNQKMIELDITYSCNLSCMNCNRSCGQAPTGDKMTVSQVEKFVRESKEKNVKWELISIVGGEPTTHPEIMNIFEVLLDYKKTFSPKTTIQLVTNGSGDFVNSILKNVPSGIKILNSAKVDSSGDGFDSFNEAPIDTEKYKNADFVNGCKIMKYCGMGLGPNGYYPCAVASGIDRIFGFDKGKKELPNLEDGLEDQLNIFCRLCGHFKEEKSADGEVKSKVWKKAYEKYQKEKPVLKKY